MANVLIVSIFVRSKNRMNADMANPTAIIET